MLGTGNAMCVRCYNTCFCLHSPQSLLMVDAGGGNGIFRQLHRAHIAFEDIHHLFVTHTHTDHIMGVVWMIRKISPLIHKGKYQAPREKTKLSYKEQKEYDSIESEIEQLEKRSAELESEIAAAATDFPKLMKLSKEKEEVDAEIERKMDRYVELQEMVDSFNK